MRILMVTPYPPIRDGIANYAVQEVATLLREGHDVEVLSPYPSAAHHHLALRSRRGPLALAKRVAAYDRVVIQFHPDIFYPLPLGDRDRLAVTTGLLAAFARARNVEVRVHEVNFDWGREGGTFGRIWRALWRLPVRITVHTSHERTLLARSVGIPESSIDVVAHGAHFVRRVAHDRNGARARVGIDPDAFTFVCIGFVQPHKGFDRAVRAFGDLGAHGARLDVVGTVRVDEPAFVSHGEELDALVRATPGAHRHDEYVSDDMFDTWLVAADAIVLPYHSTWTSGVLERAALYGTPVIATRVGGIDDQGYARLRLVDDDEALASAMHELVGVAVSAATPEPWSSRTDADRAAVMAEIRSRAATRAAVEALPAARDVPNATPALSAYPNLDVPLPQGRNRTRRALQRVVRRLTAWETDPIVHHVNGLRHAAIDDVRRVATGRPIDPDPPR
jgi:glycosyltransferase involved in cell wall biosynthesis